MPEPDGVHPTLCQQYSQYCTLFLLLLSPFDLPSPLGSADLSGAMLLAGLASRASRRLRLGDLSRPRLARVGLLPLLALGARSLLLSASSSVSFGSALRLTVAAGASVRAGLAAAEVLQDAPRGSLLPRQCSRSTRLQTSSCRPPWTPEQRDYIPMKYNRQR